MLNDIEDIEYYEQEAYWEDYTSILPQKFVWKTKEGKVIKLTEMTDEHIKNAIKYAFKQKKYSVIATLENERKSRIENKYFSQKIDCPFCARQMNMRKITIDDRESGAWCAKVEYQFVCKCGARSNLQEPPQYKPIKLE